MLNVSVQMRLPSHTLNCMHADLRVVAPIALLFLPFIAIAAHPVEACQASLKAYCTRVLDGHSTAEAAAHA